MTVVKRSAIRPSDKTEPEGSEQPNDVFGRVIEAAKRNGISLETWLQDAVKQDESRDQLSPDEVTLQRLLQAQRASRVEAERTAFVAKEEFHQNLVQEEKDAEAKALVDAIDDLSAQLLALKMSNVEEQSAPTPDPTPQDLNVVEVSHLDDDEQMVDRLRARISALKDRLAQPEELERAEPAFVKSRPDIELRSDIEHQPELEADLPVEPAVELLATELPAKDLAEHRAPDLDDRVEQHFAELGDKLNALLAKSNAKPEPKNDEIRQQLESSLEKLEGKLAGLPTKQDVALLQPLAKLQVKLQADQSKLGQNFQRLADEQVRLQGNFGVADATAKQIPVLQSQLTNLEATLKAIKPAMSRDVASLLDLTVQKLEKVSKDQSNTASHALLHDRLEQLEETLRSIPAEVAQQQPNAQSLISFLPPRETLEAVEHTVGRLEAMLLEQQSVLGSIDVTEQLGVFKDRFDGLVTRLDDTMKRFDSAALDADRRAQESLDQQGSQNQSLMEQLVAQIESLEHRIEQAPNLTAANQDAVEASHAKLQDDLSRIETQLSSVMGTLEEHVSKPQIADIQAQNKQTVSRAVTDAFVQPLNEALDRLERGLDARSRQTLDDLSAIVKSTHSKAKSDDTLQGRLNSVPDTLTILLNKIYDLESGVNRLQMERQSPSSSQLNLDTEQSEPQKQTHKPKHHEILPPKAAGAAKAKRVREKSDAAQGMNYISAARRAASNRSDIRSTLAKEAEENPSSLNKVKRRAEKILSRQREEIETDSDPSRRKKVIGVCLGLTLIIAAIALALQSKKNAEQNSDPLVTGSISSGVNGARGDKVSAKTNLVHAQKQSLNAANQKLPDRLPVGSGNHILFNDKAFPEVAIPTQVAVPVARPKHVATQSKPSVLETFVAPAPPTNIGPLALRYKAALGDPVAQFEIGSRYADGFGTKPDMPQAVEWYRRAAAQGLPPALYRLGSLLEHGRGAPQDKIMAASFYEKAAEKGNTKAMYNLGVLHAQGAFGEPNFKEAAKWFTAAAEAGVKDGQFNLAILHARGMGVATDLEKAYFWFAIAAKDKDPDATAKRDALGQDLLAEARAQLDDKVKNWKPKKLPENANKVLMPKEGWLALQVPKNAKQRLENHAGNTGKKAPDVKDGIQAIFNQAGALSAIPVQKNDESRI